MATTKVSVPSVPAPPSPATSDAENRSPSERAPKRRKTVNPTSVPKDRLIHASVVSQALDLAFFHAPVDKVHRAKFTAAFNSNISAYNDGLVVLGTPDGATAEVESAADRAKVGVHRWKPEQPVIQRLLFHALLEGELEEASPVIATSQARYKLQLKPAITRMLDKHVSKLVASGDIRDGGTAASSQQLLTKRGTECIEFAVDYARASAAVSNKLVWLEFVSSSDHFRPEARGVGVVFNSASRRSLKLGLQDGIRRCDRVLGNSLG